MKIVTYNVRQGGAGLVQWARVIEAFDPDLLAVQEPAPPADHLPPLHGDLGRRVAWTRADGAAGWGSAVHVRGGTLRPLDLDGFRGWLTGAEVEGLRGPAGPHRLLAFSLHAPRRGSYHGAVNAVLDLIARQRGDADVVIAGDFNVTVSQRLATETLSPTERQAAAADRAIRARLRDEFGLLNCWEAANPGVPLAQTLRWVCAPEYPFHCDGIFVPRSWRRALLSCTVAHSPEWARLSDHNPVVAEIGEML
jgi:endonuclease/exonuclease/phosphatase family metal-dependent hydrolase